MAERRLPTRDMVDAQTFATISQGSIFNFAYNETYDEDEILGLIITARCDISNDKVSKYSYLPVIPFRLWRERELISILKRIKTKSLENDVKSALDNAGFSKNTLSIYGADRLIEVASKEIKKKKTLDSLIRKVKLHELIVDGDAYNVMYRSFEKDIKSFVKELIENKVLEYHFLDDVPGYGSCVVNLREVSHLDYFVANEIAKGIDFSLLCDDQKLRLRSINTRLGDGMSSLIGLVKSPFIELIMQRFAELYTRIGVDDPEGNLYSRVCEEGIEQ